MRSRPVRVIAVVAAVVVALVLMEGCKPKGDLESPDRPGKSAASQGQAPGAPPGAPAFKGDPSAVPASGMKADAMRKMGTK